MKNTLYSNASRRFYKPSATRTPVLVSLLLITLALIAATELACRQIPAHQGIGRVGEAVTSALGAKAQRRLVARQTSATITPSPSIPVSTPAGTPISTPAAKPGSESPISSSKGNSPNTAITSQVPGGFLSLGDPPPVKSTPGGSVFLSPAGGASNTPSSSKVPEPTGTATGGYLQTGPNVPSLTPGGGAPSTPITSKVPNPTGTATGGYLQTGPDVPTITPGGGATSTSGSSKVPNPTATAIGGYLQTGPNVPTNSPVPTPAQPVPSNPSYLSVGGTVVASAPSSKYLSVGQDGQPLGQSPTNPAAPPTPTPAPAIVVVDGKLSTYSDADVATDANGSPLPVITVVRGNSITQTPVLSVVGSQTFAVTPAPTVIGSQILTATPFFTVIDGTTVALTPGVQVIDGKTFALSPVLTVVDGKTYTETPYITVIDGKTYTQTPVPDISPITATSPSGYMSNGGSSSTTTGMRPTATIVNSTGTYYAYPDGNEQPAPQITLRQYISVSFLPLIIAVVYTIPWRILDSTIREMEPFYQLHKRGGALARDSLCLDYSTSFLITVPFKSLYRGQIIVFWSSLISLSVLALAPLSAEAFFVSVSGSCGPNAPGPCNATWGVYPILARVIQGLLSFVAVLLALIIIFGFKRTSGVYNEPLSVAGLAALFHKSPFLKGLREINSTVSSNELKNILAGKRYGLSSFITADQTRCHGIVPLDMDSEAGFASSAGAAKKGHYSAVTMSDAGLDINNNYHPDTSSVHEDFWARRSAVWGDIKMRLFYIAAFIMLGGLFALITYYHWTGPDPVTGKSSGFETFMDSEGFGVRFMMTALGVVIKLFWSKIDQDFRKMEPYRRLLLGSSKPEDSILVPVWMSPISAILPSIRRAHFLVALICFVSVLAEFLPITLANIAFSPAMTKNAYEICNFMSMGILGLMLVSIVILICRPRRHVRPLPRPPTTVASVGLYVASVESYEERSFLDGLGEMAVMKRRERDDTIKGMGSLYALGIVDGNELRIDDDRRVRRLWAD